MAPSDRVCRDCIAEHGLCAGYVDAEGQPFCPRHPKPAHDPWSSAHAIVAEALEITQHDRHEKSGAPEDNFAKIAQVWSGLLADKLKHGARITPGDTARMMIGMKLCRDMHAPHRDNRVDMIGYALCLERSEPTDKR